MNSSSSPDGEVVGGHTYGAALVRGDETTLAAVLEALRDVRFTGWVAPPSDGWTVVLGDPGDGVVADGRRGIVEMGEVLAKRTGTPVLTVRVRHDRQLAIVGWRAGEDLGRYSSDPSREPGADEDVLAEPFGAEYAGVFAEMCDRADGAEQLAELLEEELDPDSVFESERLGAVARLLGLPRWLVAAGSLPKDIPTGPRAADLERLRAGVAGPSGIVPGMATRTIRRRQLPPPVIADPPQGGSLGYESWML